MTEREVLFFDVGRRMGRDTQWHSIEIREIVEQVMQAQRAKTPFVPSQDAHEVNVAINDVILSKYGG